MLSFFKKFLVDAKMVGIETRLRRFYQIDLATMPEEQSCLESLKPLDILHIQLCFRILHSIDSRLTKHDGEGKGNLAWLITISSHYNAKKIHSVLALLTRYKKGPSFNTLTKHKILTYESFHKLKNLLSAFDKQYGEIFLQLLEEAQHSTYQSSDSQIDLNKFKGLLSFDPNNQHLLPELLQLAKLLKQNNKNFLEQNYSLLVQLKELNVVLALRDIVGLLSYCIYPLDQARVNSIFRPNTVNAILLKRGLMHCLKVSNLLNRNNFDQLIQKPFEKFFMNKISSEYFTASLSTIIYNAFSNTLKEKIIQEVISQLERDSLTNDTIKNCDEDLVELANHPYITNLNENDALYTPNSPNDMLFSNKIYN